MQSALIRQMWSSEEGGKVTAFSLSSRTLPPAHRQEGRSLAFAALALATQ